MGFKALNQWGQWSNGAKEEDETVGVSQWLSVLKRKLGGQEHNYDLFNTTSVFYRDEVFKPVFDAKHFVITGYPRNAFANFNMPLSNPIWKNVDQEITSRLDQWRSQGMRLVLVAPTLRTDESAPLDLDDELVDMLEEFCARENVVFLFKFHPANEGLSRIQRQHLYILDPNSDIYPIMPLCSALVTDYSSIYMDFLLLDRPVHFYTPEQYDDDEGVGEFQFNLDSMTPGPQHKSWAALLRSLPEQWRADSYAGERSRLRQLAFDDLPQERSVPKLVAYMRDQGWIASDPSLI